MTSLKSFFQERANEGDLIGAKTIAVWPNGLILGNISTDRVPQLIIELGLATESDYVQASSVFSSRGLLVQRQSLSINNTPKDVVSVMPKSRVFVEPFYELCDFLLDRLEFSDASLLPDEAAESIREFAVNWSEFLRPSRSVGDADKLLGLIGELLTIRDWIAKDSFEPHMWTGPTGGMHDFTGREISLEVKVCGSRKGPLVHKVSHIDQLRPPKMGRLICVSFRAFLNRRGESSIRDLVHDIQSMDVFKNGEGLDLLNHALFEAGYSEELGADFARYTLLDSGLYEITDGFPHLNLRDSTLDPRVIDVVYSVDFTGLEHFMIQRTSHINLN
jgi:Putative  PD-(D/E)XK family member, (DUF4420)